MIKFYSVIGVGSIIAEEIEETAAAIIVKIPGQVLTLQGKGGIQLNLASIIPPFIEKTEARKLFDRFPIQKDKIFFSGSVSGDIESGYREFQKNIEREITGIQIVGANALSQLKGLKN
jgi:hypothetical protein